MAARATRHGAITCKIVCRTPGNLMRACRVLTYRMLALFTALTAFGWLSSQATASAVLAESPTIQFAAHCVTVHSNVAGRTGKICAVINLDPFVQDQTWQALITFNVRSGHLRKVEARSLYLQINGKAKLYRSHPHRLASGTRSELATSYIDTSGHLQAVSREPCIIWSDGGVACYRHVLHSSVLTVPKDK